MEETKDLRNSFSSAAFFLPNSGLEKGKRRIMTERLHPSEASNYIESVALFITLEDGTEKFIGAWGGEDPFMGPITDKQTESRSDKWVAERAKGYGKYIAWRLEKTTQEKLMKEGHIERPVL